MYTQRQEKFDELAAMIPENIEAFTSSATSDLAGTSTDSVDDEMQAQRTIDVSDENDENEEGDVELADSLISTSTSTPELE